MNTARLARAASIVLLSALLDGCVSTASPSLAPAFRPSPSAYPSPVITCRSPTDSGPTVEPCLSGIVVVEAAVASIGLPIVRIDMEPGFFNCGLWDGIGAPTPCLIASYIGTVMHAWVAFVGSRQVAAVTVSGGSMTNPIDPPLRATLSGFEVPPAQWAMP